MLNDIVPIALKRYAKAQGWSIRFYDDYRRCLKESQHRIKLLLVTEKNLFDIIRATGGDANCLQSWSKALKQRPEDPVILMNSPCRLQICFISALSTRVLHRDPTIPFECDCCRLMQVIRAPIFCGHCDANTCKDCYVAVIEKGVDDARYAYTHLGKCVAPVDIFCASCRAELVGSWIDVKRIMMERCILLDLSILFALMVLTDKCETKKTGRPRGCAPSV